MTDLTIHATWREIHAQPAIWQDWGEQLDVADLRDWVDGLGVKEVWLCGAGSSAYIGEILAAGLEGAPGPRLRAVPTTDIVSRPAAFLRGAPRLVVNFGRSGNSAETLGTLDALDTLAPNWPRLNITCNARSALATRTGGRAVILPEATHDAGFAMTSSFTTMLLTALAILDRATPAKAIAGRFETLARALDSLLPRFRAEAQASFPPERAVFLGAGPLAFAAREAALKVMELSAGRIPALWDTSLGFRHGPKSFVQGKTGIWLFPSSEAGVRAYDDDLTAELRTQFPSATVAAAEVPAPHGDLWSAVLHVVRAQVQAVVWSAALGFAVDDPFAGQGTLTRVVSGFRLHPVGGRA